VHKAPPTVLEQLPRQNYTFSFFSDKNALNGHGLIANESNIGEKPKRANFIGEIYVLCFRAFDRFLDLSKLILVVFSPKK
jgi:hypothetical protein